MQKTSTKHIRIRLLPEGGCVNYSKAQTANVGFIVKLQKLT